MHHLILGYGYCGYYLAQELLKHDQHVTALSRHLPPELQLPQLRHLNHDLNQPFNWTKSNTIIYYLIPPPSQGEKDTFLRQFLGQSMIKAKKVIYFGSSAVYGNHQGNWVNEQSTCFIDNSRQLRRLDAEQQWLNYCNPNSIQPIILRIAGIYGPQRLPIEAAKAQTPIIEGDKTPYTNHIYVKDLAAIAYLLAKCQTPYSLYNIADGDPQPMGTLQQLVAQSLGIEPATYESWKQAWERASPMKREFMKGSKRLQIELLKQSLGSNLSLTHLNDAIQQSLKP
jgi:nucleoside-diphosphate-sugar epimerase